MAAVSVVAVLDCCNCSIHCAERVVTVVNIDIVVTNNAESNISKSGYSNAKILCRIIPFSIPNRILTMEHQFRSSDPPPTFHGGPISSFVLVHHYFPHYLRPWLFHRSYHITATMTIQFTSCRSRSTSSGRRCRCYTGLIKRFSKFTRVLLFILNPNAANWITSISILIFHGPL